MSDSVSGETGGPTRDEAEAIKTRRERAGLAAAGEGDTKNLVGLALSGGGVRSALFNRGMLEALSKRGFLKEVDILSSVSGGGFVAGYLAALGQRAKALGSANFHADPRFWRFGTADGGETVRPRDGAEDPYRSAHAGEYLRDVTGVFGRWLLGTLPVLLLFACGLATACAAAALVWRGVDTDWFRNRLDGMGAGDFGSDMGYAFLPMLPVGLGWLAVQFAAGRRTRTGAAVWLVLFPWIAGTILAVPLFRAAGFGVSESWALAGGSAAALPLFGFARLALRRWNVPGRGLVVGVVTTAGVAGLIVLTAALLWPDRWPAEPLAERFGTGDSGIWAHGAVAAAVAAALLLCQLGPALALPALATGSGRAGRPAGEKVPADRLRRAARLATLLLIAAAIVSAAAFLGNGINSVGRNSNADDSLRWESWAGWLGLAGAATQLAAVLGFDSLFRSQQADAPTWQRAAFRFVLSGVLGLPVLALLHALASEDVSRHTNERGAELKSGDVHLPGLAGVLREDGPLREAVGGTAADEFQVAVAAAESGKRAMIGTPGRERRLTTFDGFADRIGTVYVGAGPWKGADPTEPPADPPAGEQPAHDVPDWPEQISRIETRERQLGGLLAALNGLPFSEDGPGLADKDLTRHLIDRVHRRAEQMRVNDRQTLQEVTAAVRPPAAARRRLNEAITFDIPSPPADAAPSAPAGRWPDTKRQADAEAWVLTRAADFGGKDAFDLKHYWSRATHHGLDDRPPAGPREDGDGAGAAYEDHLDLEGFTAHQLARFNHLLLSALFPEAFRPANAPSTHLVVLPDQRFRFTVLVGAGLGFTLLLFGWVDFNRHSPSFQFYRDALREHFLGPAALPELPDGRAVEVNPPLADLEPWRVGLPYPLFVSTVNVRRANVAYDPGGPGEPAAHALPRPVTEHLPFVFGPHRCGGEQIGFEPTASYADATVRLADAVTVSGSAVSPYFTDHPWLTWFMTAVNLRLGVWLPRPLRDAARPSRPAGRGAWARRPLRWGLTRLRKGLHLIGKVLTAPRRWFSGRPWDLPDPPERLPAAGAWPVFREWLGIFSRARVEEADILFVADGGFRDNLGAEQLLARRCKLIVVSDAGYNHGSSEFTALANLVTLARTELGCEFLDLDADRPLDLDRFVKGKDSRLAPQQVLALRVRYADGAEGLLMYCQMALTGREDMDLRQSREQFPNFPDEPTGNQMYSDRQVELYRRLGEHVGDVLCRNLPPARTKKERKRPLDFKDLCERLTLAFVQECAAEGAVADGEASAGRLLGAGADRRIAAGLARRKDRTAYFFPDREELARRLGLGAFRRGDESVDAAEREVDLWLRLYDADADFRLYHDARVWRRLRGDARDAFAGWETTEVPAGRLLCPGHVAVAYLACARRADVDPPPRDPDEPDTAEDRHQRGRDWQPFAAGGRARLIALAADRFRGGPTGWTDDVPLERYIESIRHARFPTAGPHGADGAADPGFLPPTRADFPTPVDAKPLQKFLIGISEAVAPERGAVQIAQDLTVFLYHEWPKAPAGDPDDPDAPETAGAGTAGAEAGA